MFKKYYICFIIFLCVISYLFSLVIPKNSSNISLPIKTNYTLTSKYGYRTLGSYHFHGGIDLAAKIGTPVYAISSGTVIYAGFYSSFGNCIIISYYNGYKSLYGHLSSDFNVRVGESVNSSTIVGSIGPKYLKNGRLNGMTTGPHLHYSLYKNGKVIDPSIIKYKK